MKLSMNLPIALLLIWLTVSLGAILPTTAIKFNTQISHNSPPIVVPPPSKSAEGKPYFMYFLQAIVIGLVAIAIVGGFFYRRELLKQALLGAISLFFALLMFGLIYLLANRVAIVLSAHGGTNPDHSYTTPAYAGNVLTLVIISIIIGTLFGLFIVKVYHKKEVEVEKEEIITTQQAMEKAIYKVKIGKDVRGAILAAYKEMEKLMKSKGVEDKKYYTPREFREFSLRTLKISERPVNILTQLFEIARYSTHPMTEEHRALALNALEEIRNETRGE